MRKPAKSFQIDCVAESSCFCAGCLRSYAVISKTETYGLTSQFRRAAVSIPANIAEGFRKHSEPTRKVLNIAEGSLEECRYYLILARDLGYIEINNLWEMSEEVGRLLNGYRTAILTPNSKIQDS